MVKIVYCFLVYDEPELLKHTIKKLNFENVSFIVHVQKSVDIRPFIFNQDNVFFIPDDERIETIWGDISCVEASLLMLRYAVKKYHNDNGYCVLLSGTDYPMKSNEYIQKYFDDRFPSDFIALTYSESNWPNSFRRVCEQNCRDYWISHPKSKIKTWIRPRRFILLRCLKRQNFIDYAHAFPGIIKTLPLAIKFFFTGSKQNPYLTSFKNTFLGKGYYSSQTWMQLSFGSVRQILDYNNPELFSRARYMHNPEEYLLQNILVSMNGTSNIRNSVLGGTKEVNDSDECLINEMMLDPDVLFYRKFHYNTCRNLMSNQFKY